VNDPFHRSAAPRKLPTTKPHWGLHPAKNAEAVFVGSPWSRQLQSGTSTTRQIGRNRSYRGNSECRLCEVPRSTELNSRNASRISMRRRLHSSGSKAAVLSALLPGTSASFAPVACYLSSVFQAQPAGHAGSECRGGVYSWQPDSPLVPASPVILPFSSGNASPPPRRTTA
jgi:hypothetical protein